MTLTSAQEIGTGSLFSAGFGFPLSAMLLFVGAAWRERRRCWPWHHFSFCGRSFHWR